MTAHATANLPLKFRRVKVSQWQSIFQYTKCSFMWKWPYNRAESMSGVGITCRSNLTFTAENQRCFIGIKHLVTHIFVLTRSNSKWFHIFHKINSINELFVEPAIASE
jgi:hypothetical protein